jgi:hypothetical protein
MAALARPLEHDRALIAIFFRSMLYATRSNPLELRVRPDLGGGRPQRLILRVLTRRIEPLPLRCVRRPRLERYAGAGGDAPEISQFFAANRQYASSQPTST